MTLENQCIENMYWFFYIWEDLWKEKCQLHIILNDYSHQCHMNKITAQKILLPLIDFIFSTLCSIISQCSASFP